MSQSPTPAQRLKTLRAELRHTQMENRLALNLYRAGARKAKRLGREISELRKQGKVKSCSSRLKSRAQSSGVPASTVAPA